MSRSTQIERIIAKGQLVPLTFMQNQVAASQTDAQLLIVETDDGTTVSSTANDEYVMPFEGEIIAISATYSADATGGTLDAEATKNGTGVGLTVQLSDTVQRDHASQLRGTDVFAAGDRIGAEITTDANWAPVTSDVAVTVWVLLYLEGI